LNKGDTAAAVRYFENLNVVDPASPEAAQAEAVIERLKK
jgi:hypothetical protein